MLEETSGSVFPRKEELGSWWFIDFAQKLHLDNLVKRGDIVPLITQLITSHLLPFDSWFIVYIYHSGYFSDYLGKILPMNQRGWRILNSWALSFCVAVNQSDTLLRQLPGCDRKQIASAFPTCQKFVCYFEYMECHCQWNAFKEGCKWNLKDLKGVCMCFGVLILPTIPSGVI